MRPKTKYLMPIILAILLTSSVAITYAQDQGPLQAQVDRTSLSTDESLVLTVTVSGSVLRAPRPVLPNLPGFDDNANVVFSLANGGTAAIHASWSSHLGRNSRGVIGTRGTAMVAGSGLWNLDRFHLKTLDMEYERIDVLNDKLDVRSYRDESRHFVDCVQNDLDPTITGEDGLAALRISHAILTSHHERRVVTMDE